MILALRRRLNRVKITHLGAEFSCRSLQTIATICKVMYSKSVVLRPNSPSSPRHRVRAVESRGKATILLGNLILVFAGALWGH